MIVGTMVLTTHDAISKWLLQTLHTGEIIALRGLLSLPVVILLARLEGLGLRDLRSRAPWQTGLRGFLGLLTSALAYRLNIAAFKLASGAIVAPFRHLSLVWAAALGYAIWNDVPDLQTIIGAAIIMAASLY